MFLGNILLNISHLGTLKLWLHVEIRCT